MVRLGQATPFARAQGRATRRQWQDHDAADQFAVGVEQAEVQLVPLRFQVVVGQAQAQRLAQDLVAQAALAAKIGGAVGDFVEEHGLWPRPRGRERVHDRMARCGGAMGSDRD